MTDVKNFGRLYCLYKLFRFFGCNKTHQCTCKLIFKGKIACRLLSLLVDKENP